MTTHKTTQTASRKYNRDNRLARIVALLGTHTPTKSQSCACKWQGEIDACLQRDYVGTMQRGIQWLCHMCKRVLWIAHYDSLNKK